MVCSFQVLQLRIYVHFSSLSCLLRLILCDFIKPGSDNIWQEVQNMNSTVNKQGSVVLLWSAIWTEVNVTFSILCSRVTWSQNMQHRACLWSVIQRWCGQKTKTLFCCKINSPTSPYTTFTNLLLFSLSKGHKITIILYKFLSMSQDSWVGTVTGLQAGGSRTWIQVQATYLSLPQTVHTSSEENPAPYSLVPGFLPKGKAAEA